MRSHSQLPKSARAAWTFLLGVVCEGADADAGADLFVGDASVVAIVLRGFVVTGY